MNHALDGSARRSNGQLWLALPMLVLAATLLSASARAQPEVVSSILPVHALVAAVTDGVAEPGLLLSGSASPHHFQLRPSQMRVLQGADIVFWIGPELETFLVGPFEHPRPDQVRSELGRIGGMRKLRNRSGGLWHGSHADHDHELPDSESPAHVFDAHYWLDPNNAVVMARHIESVLSVSDPDRADLYARNADELVAALQILDVDIDARLAPVRDVPFMVFHDAYQYFETRYHLNAIGAIVLSPDRLPGARRVRELTDTLKQLDSACVFHEPQHTAVMAETIARSAGARLGVLDSIGAGVMPGPDAYFELMWANTDSVVSCLSGP